MPPKNSSPAAGKGLDTDAIMALTRGDVASSRETIDPGFGVIVP